MNLNVIIWIISVCFVMCVMLTSHMKSNIFPPDSPLLLLSSTSTISLRRWPGVLFMADWMERRMTDSASFTKMNTMLTCGRSEGYDVFLHLHGESDERLNKKTTA